MTKKPAWSILRYCALLVIGNAMFALGFNLFLVPNSLNVGGLSGIAMILQRVLGKGGIGLYTAVMNVPLFINQGDKIRIDTRTGEYMERA